MPKLAATSVANITLGVTKDSLFAMWFGAGGASSSFPVASWAVFIFRDVLTMAAGFILPALAAAELVERKVIREQATADVAAQLSVPMVCQAALTPFHLLALDIYNRPGKSLANRAGSVRELFPATVVVRVARVGFVYGLAGIGNKHIKKTLRDLDAAAAPTLAK